MASKNLELVRSICDAWERGDFSSAEWAHPEIEFVRVDGPSPARWTGPTGLAEGTRDWIGAWKEARMEADEYRELDEGRVLVLVRFRGRGRTSGMELREMQSKGAHLFDVRDGKVRRLLHYFERDRALADLGLTPEAEHGNAAVLRRAFDAINRGDVDRHVADFADDVRADFSRTIGPYQGVYRGVEDALRRLKDFQSTWDEVHWSAEAIRELPGECIVVTVLLRVTGRNGVQAEARGGQVWRFRNSKVIEICAYESREAADAAVALK
jgi:ketosteroid isomerase-like protein